MTEQLSLSFHFLCLLSLFVGVTLEAPASALTLKEKMNLIVSEFYISHKVLGLARRISQPLIWIKKFDLRQEVAHFLNIKTLAEKVAIVYIDSQLLLV